MPKQNFEMRSLKTSDFFHMSKILRKMKLKFEAPEDMSQQEMGIMMVQKVLENLDQAQNEINTFLADLVGITAKEFNDLPITDTIKIFGLFKEQEGLADFLKQAMK